MTLRTSSLVSGLLVATLALGGCSGDDNDANTTGDNPSAGGDASESPTASDAPATDSPNLPKAPVLKRAEGAAGDLTWAPEKCGTDAGRQKVSGSVTNSTKKPFDYVVNVSWGSSENGNTLGRGIATVRQVKPGEKATFEVSAKVDAGADQCVINVLRGVLTAKKQR